MATYYWVGGSGNWDATSTANWASSSGGAGGAGVPTSVDDVIFDANSNIGTGAFSVTITGTAAAPATCNDFSTGGAGGALDGAMTLTMGATAVLDCYGSMTLPASNFIWSGTNGGVLNYKATTTGKTVTTNGVILTATIINFNGIGGEWTLGSAFTNSVGNMFVLAGTFNTANFNITSGANFASSGTDTRAINFGSSTISCAGSVGFTYTGSGLTFNAGTSTITCSGTSVTFAGNGLTFYNVSFTSVANGTITINGANTFNNLTFTSRSATGQRIVVFGANQTINGALTFGIANTSIRRMTVRSSVVGTPRTLTLNGTLAALADVDFRDIVAAGTVATPWTGTRLADCLGNSNITFNAPKTVYRVGTGNWSATQWSLLSGGAVDVNNFPLAQDTMVFDAGTVTGTHTIDSGWQLGTLNCSLLAVAATIATGTQTPAFYGNIVLDADITLTGTGLITFAGQGVTRQITTAGDSFTQPLTIDAPLGTVQLQDNLTTAATNAVTLTAGTLNLNNQTLSTGLFSSSNSNTRTIAFGTGKIVVTSNNATVWTTSIPANLTITGTPVVEFTYAGSTGTRTITAGPERRFNIYITAGTDTVTSGGTSGFGVLDFTGFAGTLSNAARLINGNLVISNGMTLSAGTSSLTFDGTVGTQQITTASKTFDFPIIFNGVGGTFAFQDALTQSSTRAFTITNGTVQLKNGVTSTVGAFATSGTNQKFLQSTTPGSQATLSQASGTVTAQYLTIRDINATGGATWNAFVDQGNIDAGNNDGWDFGISPIVGGNEYTYQLRSFTQPRRF